jgi:hypothetical protein
MRRRDHGARRPAWSASRSRRALPGLEESRLDALGSLRQLADLVEEHGAQWWRANCDSIARPTKARGLTTVQRGLLLRYDATGAHTGVPPRRTTS